MGKVMISGEVKYGETSYRVSSPATIFEKKHGAYALCCVDEIDGDHNVCVLVKKSIISRI